MVSIWDNAHHTRQTRALIEGLNLNGQISRFHFYYVTNTDSEFTAIKLQNYVILFNRYFSLIFFKRSDAESLENLSVVVLLFYRSLIESLLLPSLYLFLNEINQSDFVKHADSLL